MSPEPNIGEPTGLTDCHLNPIFVGDRIAQVHRHNGSCCEHLCTCTVRWNEAWNKLGLQADDGEWISGMGIVAGYALAKPEGKP
jgi:hypothetical protein